jgi:hypothetical protein
MPGAGFEPALPFTRDSDFKSDASTDSAIPAIRYSLASPSSAVVSRKCGMWPCPDFTAGRQPSHSRAKGKRNLAEFAALAFNVFAQKGEAHLAVALVAAVDAFKRERFRACSGLLGLGEGLFVGRWGGL